MVLTKPKIALIGVCVALFVFLLVGFLGPAHYTSLQTDALVLTLTAVLSYAEITRRMYHEIKRQADTAAQSHDSYKLSIAAEWLLKLDNEFDGRDLTTARMNATEFLLSAFGGPSRKPEQKAQDAMEEIWDFFDILGVLLRRGVLDLELVHSAFFHWVNAYWFVTKKYFDQAREGKPERWKDFVFVVDKLREFEKAQNPTSEDLNWSRESQLQFVKQELDANVQAFRRYRGY